MSRNGMAHRGYPGMHAENSLASFQSAIDRGFAYLELDVHLSRDGVPMVFHDETLQRMTGEDGRIQDYICADLQHLQLPGGERIPTLEEALGLARGKIRVEIELKQAGDRHPGLEEAVLAVVDRLEVYDEVFVASFDHYSIQRLRELSEQIELGIINSSASPAFIPWMRQYRVKYLSIGHPFITDAFVRTCEAEDIQLIAWTVDDEAVMRRFRSDWPGVIVCTNELDRWLAVEDGTGDSEADEKGCWPIKLKSLR